MNKPKAVCKDMLIYFYLVMAIWLLGILCKEKSAIYTL